MVLFSICIEHATVIVEQMWRKIVWFEVFVLQFMGDGESQWKAMEFIIEM